MDAFSQCAQLCARHWGKRQKRKTVLAPKNLKFSWGRDDLGIGPATTHGKVSWSLGCSSGPLPNVSSVMSFPSGKVIPISWWTHFGLSKTLLDQLVWVFGSCFLRPCKSPAQAASPQGFFPQRSHGTLGCSWTPGPGLSQSWFERR